MKYVCLVYIAPENLQEAPASECLAYAATLQESGQCLAAEALQCVETATTVRVRNGTMSITDGPFAETKEHLAGFYLVDARNLGEAIQVASKIPPVSVGSVEIRPIVDLGLLPV
jgi:hypothetical protein